MAESPQPPEGEYPDPESREPSRRSPPREPAVRPGARYAPGHERGPSPPGGYYYRAAPEPPPEQWAYEGDRGRSMASISGRTLAWVGLLIGLAIAIALWVDVGQQRYQGCVQAANARYGSASDNLTRLSRQSDVKRCTRSPF